LTILSNQYNDDWDGYLRKIEEASSKPLALGITDYYSLRSYEKFLEYRRAGRASNVSFVFANIEFRLNVQTTSDKAVNIHLLISPDAELANVKVELATLTYSHLDEVYHCGDASLRKLGRAFHQGHRSGNSDIPDETALKIGTEQFKLEWKKLVELRNKSEWNRKNFLIALSSGKDGLQGVRADSSFASTEVEWVNNSDFVFGSNPGVRKYYSDEKSEARERGIRPTPCLHGSDAHGIERVLAPDLDRHCWLKSDLSWEGLKQTIFEPTRRVFIGASPPSGPTPSNVIESVTFENATWLGVNGNTLPLNSGLVTIIGARGSGKTAFADLIAIGAGVTEVANNESSFVFKAGALMMALQFGCAGGVAANTAKQCRNEKTTGTSRRQESAICRRNSLSIFATMKIHSWLQRSNESCSLRHLRRLGLDTPHLTNCGMRTSHRWRSSVACCARKLRVPPHVLPKKQRLEMH